MTNKHHHFHKLIIALMAIILTSYNTIAQCPIGQIGQITGAVSRTAGSATSNYSISAVTNASSYIWTANPALAGSFTGSGTSVAFVWNPNYYGAVIIGVKAVDNCSAIKTAFLTVNVDLPTALSYSYVKETNVLVPVSSSLSAIEALPIGQKGVGLSYLDEMGRTIQQVSQASSPLMNDVVQAHAYDPLGREISTYLPYTTPAVANGSYKSNPLSSSAMYYDPSTPGASNIATTKDPVAQKAYDDSPLQRVLETSYPGTAWILGGGHTTKSVYDVNDSSDPIKSWIPNSGWNGAISGNYVAGTLQRSKVTDENGNTAFVYTDDAGKMVCKKIQSGPSTFLYTYYIYDGLGNLRYVIPPLPTVPSVVNLPTSFVESDAVFQNFMYGYHYDQKNRLVEKKVPGKGWEYNVYNKLDQVILSQTPAQLAQGVWAFTKYDVKGRVIQAGNYLTNATRATLQTSADNFNSALLFETFNNSATNYGYTDVSYPDNSVSSSKKLLGITYYDNYTFLTNTSINPNAGVFTVPPAVDTILTVPQGLVTGSVTNVLGAPAPTYLLNVNHYDTHGRVGKTIGQTYYLGTAGSGNYDVVENQYTFDGLLTKSARSHYLAANLKVTVNTFYNYDKDRRKTSVQQQYDSGLVYTLAQYEYNELGQLVKKSLHAAEKSNVVLGTADAYTSGHKEVTASQSITLGPDFSVTGGATFHAYISPFLQTINYSYNIRGWLTKINDPANMGSNTLFAEQLNYEQPNISYSNTTPQYNGNISTSTWQTLAKPSLGVTQEAKGFVYNYDMLNRLTSAYYKAPSGNDKFNETVSYDELGNILSLDRNATASSYVNKLSYNYGSGSQRSNTLLSVTDIGSEAYSSTFSYNTSGSETANSKIGLQQIQYNELNLPSQVTLAGNKTISFAYNNTGVLLEKITKIGATVAEDRSYVNGIEYVGSAMEFIHHEEGRARPVPNRYVLEYAIKDHLGNTRALLGDENNDKVFIAEDDIAQAIDYYAFGKAIPPVFEANPQFQYKYNGKEYSADLQAYNFGARYLNPVTGRWNGVDGESEKSRRWSPFTYCYNNPIRNIDPDGNTSWDFGSRMAFAQAQLVSGGYNQAMTSSIQNMGWDLAAADYYAGKSNYLPSQRDPYYRMTMDAIGQDAVRMYGAQNYGAPAERESGLWSSLNQSSSSGSSGLSNFLIHLTPFGGIVDFANAAREGNVLGAALGLASTASFGLGLRGAANSVESAAAGIADDAFVHVTTPAGAKNILQNGLDPEISGFVTRWGNIKHVTNPSDFNTMLYSQKLWQQTAGKFDNGYNILQINAQPNFFSPRTNWVNGIPQYKFDNLVDPSLIKFVK